MKEKEFVSSPLFFDKHVADPDSEKQLQNILDELQTLKKEQSLD